MSGFQHHKFISRDARASYLMISCIPEAIYHPFI